MREITSQNAAQYLRETRPAATDEVIEVRDLAGGVSNVVLLVTLPERGERFVLKQARGQLRVAHEWLCPVERIRREIDVLREYAQLLTARNEELGRARSAELGTRSDGVATNVPSILWEDRENFLYAMTAAPAEHKTWKEMLLAGATDEHLAEAAGRLLGRLHAGSWHDATLAAQFADRSFFDQLRLDPYYRQIARVHTNLAPTIGSLIESVLEHQLCLVHGDFSPKNLLVSPGQLLLIDFEVGHFGDPAFDLGFFLTHLALKSVWAAERGDAYLSLAAAFWNSYRATLREVASEAELFDLEQRMLGNWGACLLARIDGKSPVDYLSVEQRERVRRLACGWLNDRPRNFAQALERLSQA